MVISMIGEDMKCAASSSVHADFQGCPALCSRRSISKWRDFALASLTMQYVYSAV